ncbi:MAG: hypothetical protein KAG53_05225 [Endozoicomonadaceae bacterium]|nr:hypothetical protein [Endozoicomonadaceae bacterium]
MINEYQKAAFQAMKQHCYVIDRNYKTFVKASEKKSKPLVQHITRNLTIDDDGAIHCNKCKQQLHKGDRNNLIALSESCVKVIQHAAYSIVCSESQRAIDEKQKTIIYCYPDIEFDKNKFDKLRDSLFQCNIRPTEQTIEQKKHELDMIKDAAINYNLFCRPSTSNASVPEYGCSRCGIIMDHRLAEHLLYGLKEAGKYMGSYLNQCSPICHNDRRSQANSSTFSLDNFHEMVREEATSEQATGANRSVEAEIDRLFENHFSPYNGFIGGDLKNQIKQTFKIEFNKRNSDEQQAILSNPDRSTSFCQEINPIGAIVNFINDRTLAETMTHLSIHDEHMDDGSYDQEDTAGACALPIDENRPMLEK